MQTIKHTRCIKMIVLHKGKISVYCKNDYDYYNEKYSNFNVWSLQWSTSSFQEMLTINVWAVLVCVLWCIEMRLEQDNKLIVWYQPSRRGVRTEKYGYRKLRYKMTKTAVSKRPTFVFYDLSKTALLHFQKGQNLKIWKQLKLQFLKTTEIAVFENA